MKTYSDHDRLDDLARLSRSFRGVYAPMDERKGCTDEERETCPVGHVAECEICYHATGHGSRRCVLLFEGEHYRVCNECYGLMLYGPEWRDRDTATRAAMLLLTDAREAQFHERRPWYLDRVRFVTTMHAHDHLGRSLIDPDCDRCGWGWWCSCDIDEGAE